jgi:hypothetical protein
MRRFERDPMTFDNTHELEVYEALEQSAHGLVFLEICRAMFGPSVEPKDERAEHVAGFLASLVIGRTVYLSRVDGLPDRYFLAPEGMSFLRHNRRFSPSAVQEV